MSESKSSNNGIGLGGVLMVLFIGLKLTHYIAWSWLWVLSPMWIPILFVLGIAAVVGILAVLK